MRRNICAGVLAVATLVILVGSTVSAAEPSNRSAVGTWTLDIKKSSYGNMPAPKVEQLIITTDNPDALKWRLVGATNDGKTYTSSYDGPVDTKGHPMVSSDAGSMIAYTRIPGGIRWVVKDKGGATVETARAQLSPDSKIMIIEGTISGSKGMEKFVSVFNKTK